MTENETSKVIKITEGIYTENKIRYFIPTDYEIDTVKMHNEMYFDTPEELLETWLHYWAMYGSKLIIPVKEHFMSLTDEDMPENYHEEFIKEFDAKVEAKLFMMKEKRFRLMKDTDEVSKAFSKELTTRNITKDDNYITVEEVLSNMGYNKKEIEPALKDAFQAVGEMNDAQKLLEQTLKTLCGGKG